MEPSFASPDSIIPVDLQIRLDLIKEICKRYEAAGEGPLKLTQLELSAILIMPLSTLQLARQMPPQTISIWLPTSLYPRFMVQGKIPNGITGIGTSSVASGSASANTSPGQYQNAKERENCLQRDNGVCVLTGSAHPQICHILPYAINAKQVNIDFLKTVHSSSVGLMGTELAHRLRNLVGDAPGSSDKSWNMLSLHPQLHSFWGKCLFGIKCLGITPSDNNQSSIQLQFHWMPKRIRTQNDLLKAPYKDAVEDIIQSLAHQGDTIPGFSIFKDGSGRILETGETFNILLDKDDAEKMKVVLDVQWAVVRLSALSGAAGNWELANDPIDEEGAGDTAVRSRVEDWMEDLPSSTPH